MTIQKVKRNIIRKSILVLGIFVLFIVTSLVSIFTLYHFFGISSSNAVLYFIKDDNGSLAVTNDLAFHESDKLLFMVDASCVFSFFEGVASSAYNHPVLEVFWNKEKQNAIIKEFRPDGTKLLMVFSRYEEEEGRPQGLFLGGDLSYGDIERWKDRSRSNTGFAFFDGHRWYHIWCSLNESLILKGIENPVFPADWNFIESKIIRSDASGLIIRSIHEFNAIPDDQRRETLLMTRTFYKRSGEDYVVMKIEYTNTGDRPVMYDYSLGDEPWVGDFGDSSGDVGWSDYGIFKREAYIFPKKHSFIGYWDFGNDLTGESHAFTGYANFIEWLENPPTIAYFSNHFEVSRFKENSVLNSQDNRILNLLWLSESLAPNEKRSYTFALGMAKPDVLTGLPVKPKVSLIGTVQ